jgi:hypothetical protein
VSSTVVAVPLLLACPVVLVVSPVLKLSSVFDVPEQEATVRRSTKWSGLAEVNAFRMSFISFSTDLSLYILSLPRYSILYCVASGTALDGLQALSKLHEIL